MPTIANPAPFARPTKRGRRPKQNVPRHPSGRLYVDRAETEREALQTALDARGRQFGAREVDHLLGSALGRLRRSERISGPQHVAGEKWAKLVHRYCGLMGIPLGLGSSPGIVGQGGRSVTAEPDEEYILKLRGEYSDCFSALTEAGNAIGDRNGPARICRDVCVRDAIDDRLISDANLGTLRVGLNALVRVLT